MAQQEQHKQQPTESPAPISPAPQNDASPSNRGLRIFISGCNSLLGYMLIEELRNDHIEDEEEGKAHLFVGTLDPLDTANTPPTNVKRILNSSRRSFSKVLSDCDVIIYNVRTADPHEIRLAAASTGLDNNTGVEFRELNPETDKTFILVSTLDAWAGTKSAAEPFEDKDFVNRVPPVSSLELKLLENEVMAGCRITNATERSALHPHKRSYVVCTGLIYGCGEECEESLQNLFMHAWNCGTTEADGLLLMDEGRNVIPTIHVKDLAKMIGKLVLARPDPQEHPYLLAVDRAGPTQTQGAIVDAIAKKIGVETVVKAKYAEIKDDELRETMQPLTVDLSMRPSAVFDSTMAKDDWHCESGLVANIDRIFEELKVCKGLRAVRAFITGPPAAGKTRIADWYLFAQTVGSGKRSPSPS